MKSISKRQMQLKKINVFFIIIFIFQNSYAVDSTKVYEEKLPPNKVRVFCTKLNPSKLSIFSISTEHEDAIYSLITPRAWPIDSCIMRRDKFLKIKKNAKWLLVTGRSLHDSDIVDDEIDYFGNKNPPYNSRKSIFGDFINIKNDRGECVSYFEGDCR
jgi:hypothetical protein